MLGGLIEHFSTTGMQPGAYQLRVTVVGLDGNTLTTSGIVPITITGQ